MAALEEGPHPATVERVWFNGHDGVRVEGIHARPEDEPSRGLVLIPDIMGVRELFDDLCRRIATHGIAVLAVEPWARLTPAQRASLDVQGRMESARNLRDQVQLGDLEGAAEWLGERDGVGRTAVLGFCMGGMYALKAAALGRFDRAVAFYGMVRVPENWRGPGQADALDLLTDACPTLAIVAGRDEFVPGEDIDALRRRWQGSNEHEIVVYPEAEHGFVHDPARPTHRAQDAADAWRRVLAFLGRARVVGAR
ncbi:MAG: dienelactone hydrolase family protein, partial [Acidimicrobiia bacterium]